MERSVELKRRHGDRIRDAGTNGVLAQLAVGHRDRDNVSRASGGPPRQPQPTKEPKGMSRTAKILVLALTILLLMWVFAELGN
jgi:hypothetical protein